MWNKLCEPEHLIIIILALIVALAVTGAGKGIGTLMKPFIKKLLGRDQININVGDGGMGERPPKVECGICGLMVDPNRCPLHAGEHDRSLRNEKDISLLKSDFKDSLGKLWGKLDSMETVMTEIKVAVAKLVVKEEYSAKSQRS